MTSKVVLERFPCTLYNLVEVQLWFARNGSISIRDQLVTQLMLAIVSGELAPGRRLPSTRALAKRFQLHANTVSAAYQQLQDLGWVEPVRGSGVYVRTVQNESGEAQLQAMDRLVFDFLRGARSAGLTAGSARARLDHWLGLRPRRFVFVHPDEGLRAIVCQELRQALAWQVLSAEPDGAGLGLLASDSILLTVPSKHAEVRAILPAGIEVVAIQVRSIAESLATYLPVRPEVLIVIASGWPAFLDIARTVLTAAGYDPEALLFRDTKDDRWRRAVGAGAVVVCDVLTAGEVPDSAYKIVFALVSDAAIADLKAYERFYGA
jgi:DNA-binding transcriptional regulator YhcF (GntR family)